VPFLRVYRRRRVSPIGEIRGYKRPESLHTATLQGARAVFPGKRPTKVAVEGRRTSDHGGDNNQTGLYGTLEQ
jgi:hypothetical protein